MKIVIIGGVAGGMSAATRLRRLSESAQITVLERSGHVSFANCGLPYYVGGVITERDSLLVQTPERLRERFNLDVRVQHEATGIDRKRQVVTGIDLASREPFELPYDSLLLSPGAHPIVPPIKGIERAISLRDIEDTDVMAAAVPHARTAAVIGGGFIGLEVAENLILRGLDVTLIEALDQVMAPLDPEMMAPVHQHLRDHGLKLALGKVAAEITSNSVVTTDGEQVRADLVARAIGVRPETGLARDAGLTIGELGGIAVDGRFRTNDPKIYAIGDAAEKIDSLTGNPVLLPLAGPANRQGRRVADVMAGRESSDRPVQGTSIISLFGLQVAATGWNEKRLRAAGRSYRAIHTHPSSHAGYYPGAVPLSLKLLVDPETDQILGAQGVGMSGIDKRIDVIATAMRGGLTASELTDIELTYAPPFNSAKDPVNMLGYVAEGHQDGLIDTVQWHELDQARAAGAVLLDVRTAEEFRADGLAGSVHSDVDQLRERLSAAQPGDPLLSDDLIVYCVVGIRGYLAARIIALTASDEGRRVRVRNLDGGLVTWQAGQDSQAVRARQSSGLKFAEPVSHLPEKAL